MATAKIKFTIEKTAMLNLDSPTWPENMTDEEKVQGWVFAARQEPLLALQGVEISKSEIVDIDGAIV